MTKEGKLSPDIDADSLLSLDEKGRRIYADDGTDLSLIRSFLKLTPIERLEQLQAMTDFILSVRDQNVKCTTSGWSACF